MRIYSLYIYSRKIETKSVAIIWGHFLNVGMPLLRVVTKCLLSPLLRVSPLFLLSLPPTTLPVSSSQPCLGLLSLWSPGWSDLTTLVELTDGLIDPILDIEVLLVS